MRVSKKRSGRGGQKCRNVRKRLFSHHAAVGRQRFPANAQERAHSAGREPQHACGTPTRKGAIEGCKGVRGHRASARRPVTNVSSREQRESGGGRRGPPSAKRRADPALIRSATCAPLWVLGERTMGCFQTARLNRRGRRRARGALPVTAQTNEGKTVKGALESTLMCGFARVGAVLMRLGPFEGGSKAVH